MLPPRACLPLGDALARPPARGPQGPRTQGQEPPAAAPGPCPHPPGPGSLRRAGREGTAPAAPDPAPLAFWVVNTVPSMLQKQSLQGGTRTDSRHLTGSSARQEQGKTPVTSYCRLLRLLETALKGWPTARVHAQAHTHMPTICTKTRGCWSPEPGQHSPCSAQLLRLPPTPPPWAGSAGRRCGPSPCRGDPAAQHQADVPAGAAGAGGSPGSSPRHGCGARRPAARCTGSSASRAPSPSGTARCQGRSCSCLRGNPRRRPLRAGDREGSATDPDPS